MCNYIIFLEIHKAWDVKLVCLLQEFLQDETMAEGREWSSMYLKREDHSPRSLVSIIYHDECVVIE